MALSKILKSFWKRSDSVLGHFKFNNLSSNSNVESKECQKIPSHDGYSNLIQKNQQKCIYWINYTRRFVILHFIIQKNEILGDRKWNHPAQNEKNDCFWKRTLGEVQFTSKFWFWANGFDVVSQDSQSRKILHNNSIACWKFGSLSAYLQRRE